LWLFSSPHPSHHCFHSIRQRLRVFPAALERVITAFHPHESRILSDSAHNFLQQVTAGKRIFGATDEQHWNFQPVQMLIAKLIGFTWGMKRVTEEHEAVDARLIPGNVRRNSPTHRFSADDHAGRFVSRNDTLDNPPISRLKFGLGIRHSTLRIHVFEIEADRQKTPPREFRMETGHERREHSLACAMGKDDRRGVRRGLRFENVE